MTPTTATTEATTQAIERYLADNPGNELISTLGMTADGRIVRLAEQDECQQSALRQVFEDQLGALMSREIDGAPRERMIENSLSAVQTLGDYRDRIQRDWQIRNRLKTLKIDYADKFAVMHKRTETILDHLGQTETKGEGFVKYKEYK